MVFKLFVIFIAVLFLDLLVLPAFFGFRESFLSLLVLLVPVLYMGSTRQFIAYGFAFAFISESFRGLNLGDMTIPFLLTAIVIYLIQRFLNIKYTYDTRFNLKMLVLIMMMSVASVYIFSFFYKRNMLNIGYFEPVIVLTLALEALILILVFNAVFNKKSDYL